MKSILDPSFKYSNSSKTDLRKTFARVRALQKEEAAKASQEADKASNVTALKKRSMT